MSMKLNWTRSSRNMDLPFDSCRNFLQRHVFSTSREHVGENNTNRYQSHVLTTDVTKTHACLLTISQFNYRTFFARVLTKANVWSLLVSRHALIDNTNAHVFSLTLPRLALVVSVVFYCVVKKFPNVQNLTAIIILSSKTNHITPPPQSSFCTLLFGPKYLLDLTRVHSLARSLRSSPSTCLFNIPNRSISIRQS